MRLFELLPILAATLGLSGCAANLRSEQPPATWTAGFWFWDGGSNGAPPRSEALDVLFVQVGTINLRTPFGSDRGRWSAYATLPGDLPPAKQYWLVFRFDRQQVPDLSAAPLVAERFLRVRESARQRHLDVAGIQLDIDSPTAALAEYANFLRKLRERLPEGIGISITALLDWFRDGTSIADVIAETDEFVPQFYDVAAEDVFRAGAIAAKFDGARWAPRFNRFRKRFRIGISSFGRARLIRAANQPSGPIAIVRDVTPLDFARNADFRLETSRTEAKEQVLTYRATRKSQVGFNGFLAGDAIQFTLPTPDSVRAGADNARRIGGYCAGIIFFRWPASVDDLAMQPAEVLAAAGSSSQVSSEPGIHSVDGGCVATNCTDLYLMNAEVLSATPTRYKIRSSNDMEYFLPEAGVPVTMSGPSELTVLLPPYCGRGHMFLGRAVTASKSDYTVERRQ